MEAVEILLATGSDLAHEFLRRHAGLFGGDHDRRAMRIIRSDKIHLVAAHAHEAHPDIGLDVFHDVADVESAIGVGQGGGDEQLAGCGGGGDAHCKAGLNWANRDFISAALLLPSNDPSG